MSIMMLTMVGMVAVIMGQRLAAAKKHSVRAERDHQLRQMLMAGAAASPRLIFETDADGQVPERVKDVTLPDELTALEGRIRLMSSRSGGGLVWSVQITAWLNGHRADQVVRYVRTKTGWALSETQLGAPEDRRRLTPAPGV
jgi:hypothetical protein